MKKGITICLAVLLCFFVGCSNQYYIGQTEDPVSPTVETTPDVSPTPSILPSPDILPKPTLSPTPRVSPTPDVLPTPNVSPKPETSKLHPVVCDSFLLGGSDGKKWLKPNELTNSWERLEPSEIAKSINGGERYKLYSLDGYIGDGIGGKVYPHDENWGGGPYTEVVTIEHSVGDRDFIAVSCDWDCMPRKPVALSNDSKIYVDIVKDVLAENGLEDATVEILQNYSIDLDEDGIDEVVLYAEHTNGDSRFAPSKGAYSLLLLRKVIDGKVENIILDIDIPTGELVDGMYYSVHYVFGICGFLDLNGDSKLELITSWQYYEGFGYYVYEIANDDADHVMGNGWGV